MPDNNDSTKHVKLEYKANEPNGMYFIENNQPYGMVLNNSGAPVSDDQFATKGYVDNKIDSITPPAIDFYTIDSLPNNDTPKDWGIIKDNTTGASIGTMMGVKYLTEDQAENYGFTPSEDAPTEGHPTAENGYMLNIVDKNDSGYNKVIQKYITISGKEYIRHSNSDSAFSPWVDASGGGSGGGTGVITGEVSRDISQAVSSQGVWNYLNTYNSSKPGSGINLMALKLLTNDIEIFTNNDSYKNVRYWLDNTKRGYKLYSGDVTKMIPGYNTLYSGDPNISLLLNMPLITSDSGAEATREGSVSQLLFVNNKIFYRYGNDAYSWLSGNTSTKGWSMLRTFNYDGPIDILDGGTGATTAAEAYSNIASEAYSYLVNSYDDKISDIINAISGNYLFNPKTEYNTDIISNFPINMSGENYNGNISLNITGSEDDKLYYCTILSGDNSGEVYVGYKENNIIKWNKFSLNNSNIYYGECSSSSAAVTKEVYIENYKLRNGSLVCVKFNNNNVTDGFYLNISDTGAFQVVYKNSTDMTNKIKDANKLYLFVFSNNSYRLIGDLNTDENVRVIRKSSYGISEKSYITAIPLTTGIGGYVTDNNISTLVRDNNVYLDAEGVLNATTIKSDVEFKNPRKIDGVEFDGISDIDHYAEAVYESSDNYYIYYNLTRLPENYTFTNNSILYINLKNINKSNADLDKGVIFKINDNTYSLNQDSGSVLYNRYLIKYNNLDNMIAVVAHDNKFWLVNDVDYMHTYRHINLYSMYKVNDVIKLSKVEYGNYTLLYGSDIGQSGMLIDSQEDPFNNDNKSRLLHILVYQLNYSIYYKSRYNKKIYLIHVIGGEDEGLVIFGSYSDNSGFVWHRLVNYDDSEVQKFMNIENMKYLGWNVTDDPTVAAKYGLVGGSATVESSTDYWEHQPIENDTPDFWKTLGSGIAVFGGDGCVVSYYNNASGSTADEIDAYNNHKVPNKYMSDKSILKIHDQPHRFGIILSFPASGTGSSIIQIFYSRDFGVTEHSTYDLTKEYSYCYIRRGATHSMNFINENGYKINNNDGKNVWSDNSWVLLPISANNKFVNFGSHALSDVYDAYIGNSDKTNNEIQNMRYVFNTDKARKYRVGGISMVANQESVFILSNSTHGGGSTDTETIPAKDSDPNSDATKLWNILTNRYLYNTNIDSNNGNLTTTQKGRRNLTLLSHKYASAANTNSKVEIVNHGGIDITIGHTDSTLSLNSATTVKNPAVGSGTDITFTNNNKGIRNIIIGTGALTVGGIYNGFSAGDIYIQYE